MRALPPQIGKTYGRLTVTAEHRTLSSGRQPHEKLWFTCRCTCGQMITVRANAVRTGNTSSCGCLRRETIRQTVKRAWQRPKGKAALTALRSRYAYDAKRRGLPFDLTLDEFKAIIRENCAFCGAKPACQTAYKTNGNIVYNGVDRLDPRKGYVAGNVVACCATCNRMKGKRTAAGFVAWAQRVYQRQRT